MAFMTWDDSFSVGNPAIDTQHHHLVDLMNELHDAMKSGKGQDALSHVFTSLAEYVEMHFRTEEVLFSVTDYPDKDAHIQEHKRIMEEVLALKSKFDEGGKFITIETLNFMREWVVHHIKQTDMGYREYL